MKALKSNFYLIRIDDTPVYTGYTNRSIKTRFREHLHDKDFGDGKVTQESLGSMSFDFTWDITLINQYAKEVSTRENELIAEYGTGDSVWQKGTSGRVGGQTWNDIKHFVTSDRDNPKFAGMDEADIIELIAYQKKVKHELQNVIEHTIPKETQRLKDVIGHTIPKETRRLQNVIEHTIPKETQRLKHVISNTIPKETRRLKNVIGGTVPSETQRLKDVIGKTIPKETRQLKSVIGHTIPKDTRRLQNVIGKTKHKEHTKLQSVIANTIPKDTRRLKDIIGHTRTGKRKN